MTVTKNVPPPPRLTGQTDVDLAAVTSWAYSMYRVLTTDDGGMTGLTADVTALKAAVIALNDLTVANDTALAAAQDVLATAVDAVTVRLDAIAAITPVPGVYVLADVKAAVNAIITAAA